MKVEKRNKLSPESKKKKLPRIIIIWVPLRWEPRKQVCIHKLEKITRSPSSEAIVTPYMSRY